MARFTAIPDVPTNVAAQWESQMLDALKQNVELLCGIRGETDRISQALLRGTVNVRNVPPSDFGRLTAEGKGFTVSGVEVASLDDFGKLINDVQRLANDVARLQLFLNTLIGQLRG